MKKLLFLIVFIFFAIAGCVKPIYGPTTKRVWSARMQSQNVINHMVKNNPEILYCFDINKKDLRFDLGLEWNYCVNDVAEYMPDIIQPEQGGPYGEEVACCTLANFYTANKQYFTYEDLSSGKQEKCKELQREAEVYKK